MFFQILGQHFAQFLIQWSFEEIILCGDKGHMYSTKVEHDQSINDVKLSNWDEIFNSQKFKIGNTIRFKFERDSTSVSRRCHIYKFVPMS
jgi:hypothetical protein